MKPHFKQRGATLIEVLISVLIIGIGIFGMAGLQMRSLQANNSAYQRTQAVMLSYYIMDAMRVDISTAKALTYNTGTGTINDQAAINPICSAADVTAAGLAGQNLTDWVAALKANLGNNSSTCGAVLCDSSGACRVQVRWDDSHAGGIGQQTVQVVSRL